MFITTKVFDPSLEGQAVFVSGVDVIGKVWDGFYLVGGVDGQYIQLINSKFKDYKVHMDKFDHPEGLKLQILELPKPTDKGPEKLPFDDLDPLEIIENEPPKKKNFRSDIQIKVDNAHLENILRESFMPLKLEEILRRMRKDHGHDHWNAKNASGFVLHAIKMGKCIKKTGHAHYSYDWEAQK